MAAKREVVMEVERVELVSLPHARVVLRAEGWAFDDTRVEFSIPRTELASWPVGGRARLTIEREEPDHG